jgi:hypothetical protein
MYFRLTVELMYVKGNQDSNNSLIIKIRSIHSVVKTTKFETLALDMRQNVIFLNEYSEDQNFMNVKRETV